MAKDDEGNVHHLPTGGKAAADEGYSDGDTQSLKDLEANGATGEEDDGQFVFEIPESGKKITLGTMIPRGTPTEVRYKMSGKSIPNVSGGMIDPSDTTGLLLVPFTVEDVDTKFTRDGAGNIEKATIYIVIAPKHVVNARSEAGRTLLLGEAAAA